MDLFDLPMIALAIFGADLARYLLGAGSVWLLLWMVLEKPLRARRLAPEFPAGAQQRGEFGYSMLTVTIFAGNGILIWLMREAGWTRIYDNIAAFGWGYWCASLAAIVLAHDAYFYWTHRLLHTRLLFRLVHGVHHRSRNPSPWAAYSFHPVEALVQAVFLPLFVLLVPVHGSVIGVFLLHMILRNAVGHCGTELFPLEAARRGWAYWSTTVTHHHLHHARNRGNYGLYFAWWDRLCGTQDPDYRAAWPVARAFGAASRAALTGLAVAAFAAWPQDAIAGEAAGEWWTPGFNARVRIEACEYAGSLALKGERNLVVDGCVLMYCRSQVWRRYEHGDCREGPVRTRSAALGR